MSILNRLEKIFGRFAIKNLIIYVIFLNFLVFVLNFANDQLYSELVLRRDLVLDDRQFFRLITFIFIPPNFSPIFALFALA
ncbi:MAG: hypothetical protein ABF289_19575, partial [Clostridiales bacterium]